ncbi:MBL fold metallo-hydrolase [Chlorella sorokiniana]|uniref:MBL fold metallo-hydrolase n=1 Tax=Chlorella sorokiniana TaxID=3076 RepID=A0A2P6U1K8_CHLSO|nr:MBL fold metallo-hydrolase [Chlorella sorokiniana]|eukprot:PRW60200.1 MBL fold metallo-hydrolase [Chlorella sorokiniana]
MDTKNSLPAGSLFGIPIRLSYTLPLLFVVALLAEAFTSWAAFGWAALMYGPILLGTVLIHELGHALAARRVGGHADGILLWPLGGLAYVGHDCGPKADLWIALAGPLTHIPQFLVWFAILFPVYHAAYGSWDISLAIPYPDAHFGLAVVAGACQLNIGLVLFNLFLPAFPLDGGRILADLLLLRGVSPETAAKITASLATVLGAGVVAIGIWRTLVASVASVLTIAVGVWMLYVTVQLWECIRAGTVRQHPLFRVAASDAGSGGAGGAQLPAFAEAAAPPAACPICNDDRQYVAPSGQTWATKDELQERHRNTLSEIEHGVLAIGVEPKLAIGQQAYLIQAPGGNVLWDCLGVCHPDIVAEVQAAGGISAIVISHPHFYCACADWAEAFDCKVYLHAADRQWVTRPSPRLEFWDGDERQLGPGLRLMHLGGHFPGSCVLLWEAARDGKGVMFTGDTLLPVPSGGVTLMYSFPNMLPLPAEQVARIGRRLEGCIFDRMYGPFAHTLIKAGAAQQVQQSVRQYCGLLDTSVQRAYI